MSYEDPTTWRGRTSGGIPYRLLTCRGDVEYAKAVATEEYLVEASNLMAFIFESFPPPRLFNGIPIYAPRAMPGMSRLVTRKVTWEPWMDGLPIDPFSADPLASSLTYHPVIKVTISYDNDRKEENQDPSRPETFLEISSDTACSVLNVSAKTATWKRSEVTDEDDGGTASPFPDDSATSQQNTDPTQTIPIIVPQTEWSLTWSRLDRAFFLSTLKPILDAAMGCVNDDDVDFLNAKPETLLFCGFSVRDQRYLFGPDDAPLFDWTDVSIDTVSVTMKLLSKEVHEEGSDVWRGHNHFWRDKTGKWERLEVNGEPPYKQFDFERIFQPTLIDGLNA